MARERIRSDSIRWLNIIPSNRGAIIFAFVLVFCFAAFLRLWDLGNLPYGIYGDEAFNGMDALRTLRNNDYKVFYVGNNGREGLYIWLMAAVHAIIAPSIFALRLSSSLIGILTVLILPFTVIWIICFFSPKISEKDFQLVIVSAFAAMFFLTTSYWHVNFSRIAFRGILDPFFSVLVILLLMMGFFRSRGVAFPLAAGIVCGLGLYGYGSFKFMVFPVVFLFFVNWCRKGNSMLPGFGLFTAASFLTFLPMFLFIGEHPTIYFQRLSQTSIFSKSEPALLVFGQSVSCLVQMFFGIGDLNFRHNLGGNAQLHTIVFVFFVVGLLYLLSSLFPQWSLVRLFPNKLTFVSRDLSLFLAIWWVAMFIPPSLTYQGQPHALRSIGMICPTMTIAGIGFAITTNTMRPLWDSGIRPFLMLFCVQLIAILAFNITYDYFVRFPLDLRIQEAFNYRATNGARLMLSDDTGRRKLIVVPVGNNSEEFWPIQQFLYLSGDDLSQHNTSLIPVSNLSGYKDLPGAFIFVPTALESAVRPCLNASNDLYVF